MISTKPRIGLACLTRRVFVICSMFWLLACSSMAPQSSSKWTGQAEYGQASFYASKHQSRKTASGERFNQAANTAAHRTLPFGTRVRVTNVRTGSSVIVRINDRGPFVRGRVIDLSQSAFNSIARLSAGVISVKLEVVE